LIVLDLSMPIMNGLEAASVLRRLMPAVPIILFTPHDNLKKAFWPSSAVNPPHLHRLANYGSDIAGNISRAE
jgi:CheY-like chemotaxis protein